MIFKKTFFLILLITGILISCEDEKTEIGETALITGPDLGQCICCGGYFIDIADSTYHFEELPADSNIDLLNDTFPIEVDVDWEYDKMCGNIQYIKIIRIERSQPR